MLEKISHSEEILAIIIYKNFNKEGLKFLTSQNSALQVGYVNWDEGKKIQAHMHKPRVREIKKTMEFLYVKSGKIKIGFFSKDKEYIDSKDLSEGDCVLLSSGGHSIEFLEKSELIEVKQGPYVDKETDKELF